MTYQVALPRLLRIGGGTSAQLGDILSSFGLSRPLIVSDAYLQGCGRVDEMVRALASSGINAAVFTDTVPEPTASSIERGVAALHQGDHDCVIGFGGGSPIDSAKEALRR